MIAAQIRSLGHDVTCNWIYDTGSYDQDAIIGRKIAIRDLCNIADADVLVLDTVTQVAQDGGAGKETEFGFAIGYYQNKHLWRVGPVKNVFHQLVDKSFSTWAEFIQYLESLQCGISHQQMT